MCGKSVIAEKEVPVAVLAEAGVELGKILFAEKRFDGAANAFKKVLKLVDAPQDIIEQARGWLSRVEHRRDAE